MSTEKSSELPEGTRVIVGATGGALLGAAVAGPVGFVVGGIIGALMGAATEEEDKKRRGV